MSLPSDSVQPAAGPVPSYSFDCADLPAKQAEELLHARFGANFELRMPAGQPANQSGGQHSGMLLDDLLLGRRRMSGAGLSRSTAHVRSSQMDHYMLVFSLAQQGPAHHFFDDGRVVEQRGSEPMLLDMARPMRVQVQAGDDVSLFIPRDALDALLPRAVDLHGVVPRGMTATLLTDYLGQLLQRASTLGQAEAPLLSKCILHMVAACLAPHAESLALARPQMDGLLLRRMASYVDKHMADPDLGAQQLCSAFHMSRSRVYRLLEASGGPATFIRERRLGMAHEMLTGSDGHVVFKRLASDCGFKSASQFSRAFREHFGYNAKELRAHPEFGARLAKASLNADRSSHQRTRLVDQWLLQVRRPVATASLQ